MAGESPTHHMSSWAVLCTILLTLWNNASGSETFACSVSSFSRPLECTKQQWVRIVAETYAPEIDLNGTTCGQNISSCNTYFYDTGMLVNCNGPAWRHGVACMEDVDVGTARRLTDCLQKVQHVSTSVRYDCIEGSTILDLCNANVTLQSRSPVYLSSKGYPETTPAGKMCTCNLKGSNMKMNAVEISVRSKLPWSDDSSLSNIYRSVVSVTSGGSILWRSNDCADCTTTSLVNTNLFLPDENIRYQNVVMTYSDFGLPLQNVWVEVFELGPSVSVSCSSSPLPSDKIITIPTTSSPTTSTPTTSTPTTTIATTTTTTTPQYDTSRSRKTNDYLTTPTSGIITMEMPSGKSNSNSDSSPVVLIVTLTLILTVLVVAAAILGVVIYRKRHIFKSDDYINPWAHLQSWCYRIICQEHPRHSPKDNHLHHNSFDAVAMQDQQRHQHPSTNTPEEDDRDQHPGTVYTISSDNHIHKEIISQPNSTDCSIAGDNALIPPELYQFHQQMLDKELVKMRQERSSHTNTSTSPVVVTLSGRSTNNSEPENKLREIDDVRNTSLKTNQQQADANVDSKFKKYMKISVDNVCMRDTSNRNTSIREVSKRDISNKEILSAGTDIDGAYKCDSITADEMVPSFSDRARKSNHDIVKETEFIDQHQGVTHAHGKVENILSSEEQQVFGILGTSTDHNTPLDYNHNEKHNKAYTIVDLEAKEKNQKEKRHSRWNANAVKEVKLRRQGSVSSNSSTASIGSPKLSHTNLTSGHNTRFSQVRSTFYPEADCHITGTPTVNPKTDCHITGTPTVNPKTDCHITGKPLRDVQMTSASSGGSTDVVSTTPKIKNEDALGKKSSEC